MTLFVCLLACVVCLYCGWLVGAVTQQKRVDLAYRLGTEHGRTLPRVWTSSDGITWTYREQTGPVDEAVTP